MKNSPMKFALSLAMVGGTIISLGWSDASHACVPQPYISAVCIMAVPWTNLTSYAPANGSSLSVAKNQTLFSLIGNTYGGDSNNFLLPDLRGRVVIGAGNGPGLPSYKPGDKGGANSVVLTSANVPLAPHTHSLAGITVTANAGTLATAINLSGLKATASFAGITGTINGSDLTLKAYNGNATTGSPAGNSLAYPTLPPNRFYASHAPDVAMMAGSISGNAAITFSGSPTISLTGNATTTITGAPNVTVSGSTGPATSTSNQSAPINLMPPYLAMHYFIAVQGVFPSRY